MCGRYATGRTADELAGEFDVEATAGDGPGGDPVGFGPRYNVAPTQEVPVVLERVCRSAVPPAATDFPVRRLRLLRLLRWGLVPSWAKDVAGGARLINARAETLLEKPAFRRAAVARRALVPAEGWFEWQTSPVARDGRGRPRRQPFFLRAAAGGTIAFAGVYEVRRDPDAHPDDPTAWPAGFAIVTTAAEPGLSAVHDRMPLVLPRRRWDAWLDPELRDPDSVRALLERPEPGRFEAVPVSARVGSPAVDDAGLLDPLPAGDLRGVVDPVTGELLGADQPLF